MSARLLNIIVHWDGLITNFGRSDIGNVLSLLLASSRITHVQGQNFKKKELPHAIERNSNRLGPSVARSDHFCNVPAHTRFVTGLAIVRMKNLQKIS